MRVLHWILLALYVALIVGLFAVEIAGEYGVPVVGLVTLASQALFIFGAGTKDLARPIRRRRLVLPVAVAALMFSLLVGGATLALAELFSLAAGDDGSVLLFWGLFSETWVVGGLFSANWVFWGVLLHVYTRNLARFHAMLRLAQLVFAGSLAELLASVPSHILVERRGGCLVGIQTAIGILAGSFVMFWSFGPAIVLLFVRQAYEREHRPLPNPALRRRPRAGRFQFELRTALVATLVVSVVCALVKTFWGHWPAAAVPATLLMLVLPFPLTRHPRCTAVVTAAVFATLVWISRQSWGSSSLTALLGMMALGLSFRLFAESDFSPAADPEGESE